MIATRTMKSIFGLLALVMAGTIAPAHAQKVSAQAAQAAATHGSVRVLVMLRNPLPASSAAIQPKASQAAVAASVDRVLATLPAGGNRLVRRFKLVPAMALVVDASSLERLRAHPAVLRVDVDEGGSGHAVAPDQASVLNHVSALPATGLGGAGQKIAIIDTGVDTDHADLVQRIVGQQCFCSNASGSGGCCPSGQATQSGMGAAEDDHGHGTNVAGIMVGEGNVAPRGAVPQAQLVAVKVLDSANSFCCTSDVVAAMDWVAMNHPDVDAVNMSLGTDALYPGACDNANAFTQAMAAAVASLVSRGAVVTVSSGNQGDSTRTAAPACLAKAVGVGATWDFAGGATSHLGCTDGTTEPRQPTCFSNRSTTTDLYAAGAFVTSAGRTGGTSTYGGTSMAAPMVAACAAALKQAAPVATVEQRIDAMKLSPTRIADRVSGRTYPFLDCTDAARLLAGPRAPIRVDGSQPLVPRPNRGAAPSVAVPQPATTTPTRRPARTGAGRSPSVRER